MPVNAAARLALLAIAGFGALQLASRGLEPQAAAAPSVLTPGTPAATPSLLIQHVRIFDGVHPTLRPGHVLVVGETIAQVSVTPITPPPSSQIIDGGGRVLMPGLIDAHWHMLLAPNAPRNLNPTDPGLLYAHAVAEAERTLMRGFTTVRDTGGPTFGLKEAIDSGAIPGPRVFPSGALLSRPSGQVKALPLNGQLSAVEGLGAFALAEGATDVAMAARTQLAKGASQITLGASGHGISEGDPLDELPFSPEEAKAAVQAAKEQGTYVAAHGVTPTGIRRALDAGALSIENAHFADEASVRLIARRDAWLTISPFEPRDLTLTPDQTAKLQPLSGSWERVLRWAKAAGAKVAFGSDLRFAPQETRKQNLMLMRFSAVYSPIEVLTIATSGNAALLARSGQRNPYKRAKLGVIAPGAWADMLLVAGEPTREMSVLADPERSFLVIVKSGQVVKNILNNPGAADGNPGPADREASR